MSLMNTVTKMAVGFALAKGMEAVKKQGGLDAVLNNMKGGANAGQAGMGGLGDLLGQLTGGGSAGGLGDMLGQLTGGAGGQAAQAGALGGLGGLLGSLANARGGSSAGGFAELINQDNPVEEPDEDDVARLMLRAMAQAAQSDGELDAAEKSKLVEVLRDGDPQDVEAVQAALEEPINPKVLAADTPRGLETQVYTMSLNAIDPDNQSEAEFLHGLAEGLGLQPDLVNKIHDGIGAPRLYR